MNAASLAARSYKLVADVAFWIHFGKHSYDGFGKPDQVCAGNFSRESAESTAEAPGGTKDAVRAYVPSRTAPQSSLTWRGQRREISRGGQAGQPAGLLF